MKISLCMICGNEAAIIERCLASAAGAFDELCLVQAIGDRVPDDTLELAQAWCDRNGKGFKVGKYFNQIPGLPHVDDFAAARNFSFELATGDWQLWLDCDDYLDDVNCRRIREAVTLAIVAHTAIMCSYLVEHDGGEILRERLIKRGHGHWRKPAHETCIIKGSVVQCPQIKIYHSDHRAKHTSSAQRNATILSAALADAPRNYFYFHAELKATGRKAEATRAAIASLVLLDEKQVEELYVVRLHLAELDPENCQTHLLEAARLQPHRREAFGYLAQRALMDGRLSDATSWFRVMDALPLPDPVPWTHQGHWYGWARNYLRVKILRACGKQDLADTEHGKYLADPAYAAGVAEHELSISPGLAVH